jgi:hypothetical protein
MSKRLWRIRNRGPTLIFPDDFALEFYQSCATSQACPLNLNGIFLKWERNTIDERSIQASTPEQIF